MAEKERFSMIELKKTGYQIDYSFRKVPRKRNLKTLIELAF